VKKAVMGYKLCSVTSEPASQLVGVSGGYGFVEGGSNDLAISTVKKAEQVGAMVQEVMSW
jgi:hypothetical protein